MNPFLAECYLRATWGPRRLSNDKSANDVHRLGKLIFSLLQSENLVDRWNVQTHDCRLLKPSPLSVKASCQDYADAFLCEPGDEELGTNVSLLFRNGEESAGLLSMSINCLSDYVPNAITWLIPVFEEGTSIIPPSILIQVIKTIITEWEPTEAVLGFHSASKHIGVQGLKDDVGWATFFQHPPREVKEIQGTVMEMIGNESVLHYLPTDIYRSNDKEQLLIVRRLHDYYFPALSSKRMGKK